MGDKFEIFEIISPPYDAAAKPIRVVGSRKRFKISLPFLFTLRIFLLMFFPPTTKKQTEVSLAAHLALFSYDSYGADMKSYCRPMAMMR